MSRIKVILNSILILISFLFLSCVETEIVSKKATIDLPMEFESVLYLAVPIRNLELKLNSLNNTSKNIFQKNTIKYDLDVISAHDSLTFNAREFIYTSMEKARDLGFEYLLIIAENNSYTNIEGDSGYYDGTSFQSGTSVTTNIFEVKTFMYSVKLKKEVWRAEFKLSQKTIANNTRIGKELAEQIVHQLKRDRFLKDNFNF